MNDPLLMAVATPALPSREWGRQTLARRADEVRVWSGRSGALVTGAAVAECLSKAREALARSGWVARDRDRGLFAALWEGSSDPDALTAASTLLELLLEVRAEAPGLIRPDFEAWEARAGRTWPEVGELLAAAARFAREHGPQGGGGRG
ncbi:hypothetical protein [Streptomyces hoynatensis]|uniref:Uncharacterized protein n=1 Tax=Streptomyces hoynatensis TaxID=1141874 RepID=A0A3A9YXD4_9ACTN|nr:hypothetical protein [Streptomyces hoynatensis]RKN40782.1 hypothetical protein D7294_16980 [Streptomyces hoynatensis]